MYFLKFEFSKMIINKSKLIGTKILFYLGLYKLRRSALKTTRRLEITWRKPPTSGVSILNIASGIITKLYKNAPSLGLYTRKV